jgi:hypothetical protein
METLDDVVCGVFPERPGLDPTFEQTDRHRSILLTHISESTSKHRSRRCRQAFRVRVPLGIALSLSLSGLGGGIGWAISSSSGPSAPAPAGMPNVYTACAATTPSGLTANYIVAGSVCGPGHLPEVGSKVGFTQASPPHTYCVVTGESPIPQNMILVTDSLSCPSGYETTAPPSIP